MRGISLEKLFITLIIFTIVFVILIGVFIQFGTKINNDNINQNEKSIITMTAKENNNDIPIDNDLSDGFFYYIIPWKMEIC